MKEIGGYFGLELSHKDEYHQNQIKLNSARNAFKYILKAQNISKVYLPNYICNSVIEPLEALKINFEFYTINENFEISHNIKLEDTERLYCVNYFGLKSKYITTLIATYGEQLIVDNAQAFFEFPAPNIDTLYSARKFFGVSDGSYLYTNLIIEEQFEQDSSISRITHLVGSIDRTAAKYYPNYILSENSLIDQPIKTMSKFTETVLHSIDYKNIKLLRERNFLFLHSFLGKYNSIDIDISMLNGPMIYPFLWEDLLLRDELIKNKVYVATYWPEVLERVSEESLEASLTQKILPLPIDQRYGVEDMKRIVSTIKKYIEKG